MYPLVVCSTFVLGVTLERIVFLYWLRPRTDLLLERLGAVLGRGDVGLAIAIASVNASPVGRIALAGLRQSLAPLDRIERTIERQLALELQPLERGLSFLVATAQIATLFGLLGTTTGLQCGWGTPNADAASRATMLARGISEAMNCTAGGLFVSMCAMTAFALLRTRADHLAADLEAAAQSLRNMLVDHRARLRWHGHRAPLDRATYRTAD
jgi:biopolymer transport protein ExbB/TolQ